MTAPLLEWNWERAVHINREITDDYVASLLPRILQLKQESSQPITVGIDSVGGNIDAAEQLLKVLKGPDQDGRRCVIVTVAINKAFSARASLLTMGDYAVALPSAQIHFHDLRFGELPDVTSARAAAAAVHLNRENDELALRLAKSVVARLSWNILDMSKDFSASKSSFPEIAGEVEDLMMDLGPPDPAAPKLDLAGIVCSLYSYTSPVGDELLQKTISRLQLWRKLTIAYSAFQDRNKPDLQQQALFRDDNPLSSIVSQTFPEKPAFTWTGRTRLKDDLALLLLLVLSQAIQDKAYGVSEITITELMRDFLFYKELGQSAHTSFVMDLILQNDIPLFNVSLRDLKDQGKDEEHKKLVLELFPQARMFWAFALVLCRNLLRGEHRLSLEDARFFGLVDEVVGHHGTPEPRRLFVRRMEAEKSAKTEGPK